MDALPDPSTLKGLVTYLLYVIPIATAIFLGWVQLEIQVKVQKDILLKQKLYETREILRNQFRDFKIFLEETIQKYNRSRRIDLVALDDELFDIIDSLSILTDIISEENGDLLGLLSEELHSEYRALVESLEKYGNVDEVWEQYLAVDEKIEEIKHFVIRHLRL